MITKQTYSRADLDALGTLLDLIPKIADKDKQTLLGVALGLSARVQNTGQKQPDAEQAN